MAVTLPNNHALLFGQRRETTTRSIYWKCLVGRRVQSARHDAARRTERPGEFSPSIFARRIGISQKHLWEIENGLLEISAPEIALIATALGVHPGGLFDEQSFDYWITSPAQTPALILAKTIGQLPNLDREIIEQLVIQLDAKTGKIA